jgi:hypothetical protein
VHGPDPVGHEANTLIARLGGNRFLIVLPETGEADALDVAEKLLAGLDHLSHAVRDATANAAYRMKERASETSRASDSSLTKPVRSFCVKSLFALRRPDRFWFVVPCGQKNINQNQWTVGQRILGEARFENVWPSTWG